MIFRSLSIKRDPKAPRLAVIEGMLQSSSFLFWMESASRPEWKPYTTASRLSYFLWNTMPDDAILDAAAKGELEAGESGQFAAHTIRLHRAPSVQ